MNKQYDAVIVGGGAAGLMAAVVLARTAPGIQIALLEKNDRVGKKLLTTGNGRCNLSNAGPLEGRYHGGKAFAAEVFRRFGREETLTLFREIGIPVVELEDQKLFPMSLQAGSVVDQLRFMAEQLGVQLCCCCEVRGILCREDFSIKTSMGEISARQVLVACGGRAAAATGSDGSGYALLENFGHHLTRTYPAIVQLTTDTAKIKPLTGIKTKLTGPEARSSSPVRILRDETYQSNVRGLFPCGEGAGYAGGIMSAAVDGIKVAEAVIGEISVLSQPSP